MVFGASIHTPLPGRCTITRMSAQHQVLTSMYVDPLPAEC